MISHFWSSLLWKCCPRKHNLFKFSYRWRVKLKSDETPDMRSAGWAGRGSGDIRQIVCRDHFLLFITLFYITMDTLNHRDLVSLIKLPPHEYQWHYTPSTTRRSLFPWTIRLTMLRVIMLMSVVERVAANTAIIRVQGAHGLLNLDWQVKDHPNIRHTGGWLYHFRCIW